jgi:hypothetical protein
MACIVAEEPGLSGQQSGDGCQQYRPPRVVEHYEGRHCGGDPHNDQYSLHGIGARPMIQQICLSNSMYQPRNSLLAARRSALLPLATNFPIDNPMSVAPATPAIVLHLHEMPVLYP